MSVRQGVTNGLAAQLPGYKVLPYARALDGVESVVVMVQVQSYTRVASRWDCATSVYVIVGVEDPERAEDALDDALEAVLNALSLNNNVSELSANRIVWADKYHAYEINISIPIG